MSLLTFRGAVAHDPDIDAWLADLPGERGEFAREYFACFRACGDDVRELMHDGHPTVCVGDAALGYVGVFTAHVSVGFFCGAELPDPAGLLEGTGKRMRHVKLRPGVEVDGEALRALIAAAHADIKLRLDEISRE